VKLEIEERFIAQKACDGKEYLASRTSLGMKAREKGKKEEQKRGEEGSKIRG
jgi:hypothetical protein